jgi:hypothetical protein
MSAKNRKGSFFGLLKTALFLGLAAFGVNISMHWYGQDKSPSMELSQANADRIVEGYCHRQGAPVCTPQLIDVTAVPGHSGPPHMGWSFLYQLSASQQMRINFDENGAMQLASALSR